MPQASHKGWISESFREEIARLEAVIAGLEERNLEKEQALAEAEKQLADQKCELEEAKKEEKTEMAENITDPVVELLCCDINPVSACCGDVVDRERNARRLERKLVLGIELAFLYSLWKAIISDEDEQHLDLAISGTIFWCFGFWFWITSMDIVRASKYCYKACGCFPIKCDKGKPMWSRGTKADLDMCFVWSKVYERAHPDYDYRDPLEGHWYYKSLEDEIMDRRAGAVA